MSPVHPKEKASKSKAAPRFPVAWPVTGTREFQALSAAEKSWVERMSPWFFLAITMGDPSCMLREARFEAMQQEPWAHIPFLVKYLRVKPAVFGLALRTLTGHHPGGATVAATHRAWMTWLRGQTQPLPRAAE